MKINVKKILFVYLLSHEKQSHNLVEIEFHSSTLMFSTHFLSV